MATLFCPTFQCRFSSAREKQIFRSIVGLVLLPLFFSVSRVAPLSADDDANARPEARKSPAWVDQGVMYQINPRAFTPEGTLKAATSKLEDLSRLGITMVYLWPIFESDDDPRTIFWSPRQVQSKLNNPKNPYRIKDYFKVDPEYGTDADLKEFVETAHRLGMKVLFDLVFHHCGPSAVFIKEHPGYILRDEEGRILYSRWNFPKLNFENPELREYLWKNMEYWVREFDIDGYRTDVSDAIPLDFWITGRRRLEKIKPDIVLLAEGSKPENQLDAFDMNYGFPIYPVIRDVMDGKKPASDLVAVKKLQEARQPKGGRFIHYTDNHDIASDGYENRHETRWTEAGCEAALVACFTFDGVPLLYNGQEIADRQRHSLYGNLAVDWSKAETAAGKERLAFCQKIIPLRKAHPALCARGATRYAENDLPEAVVSFERTDGNEKILVVVNLRKKPATVRVRSDFAPLKELMSRGKIKNNQADPVFELPEYGWWIGIVSSRQ